MNKVDDLKALVKEATKEIYNTKARRCWLLHTWTKWSIIPHPNYTTRSIQYRYCLHCGEQKFEKIPDFYI